MSKWCMNYESGEMDLASIEEYEKLKKKGKVKTRPIGKLWEEIGLDD